jgi:hypothetical protein
MCRHLHTKNHKERMNLIHTIRNEREIELIDSQSHMNALMNEVETLKRSEHEFDTLELTSECGTPSVKPFKQFFLEWDENDEDIDEDIDELMANAKIERQKELHEIYERQRLVRIARMDERDAMREMYCAKR